MATWSIFARGAWLTDSSTLENAIEEAHRYWGNTGFEPVQVCLTDHAGRVISPLWDWSEEPATIKAWRPVRMDRPRMMGRMRA